MVVPELSTGRMDPRVVSGHDFDGFFFWVGWSGRVSTSEFLVFHLLFSLYLNRYEFSNTTFD